MHEMDIEPPQAGGEGYTSLRDTAQSADKGKARVGKFVLDLSAPATKKRVFNAEADTTTPSLPTSAWLNSTASAAVASFLHGPALPPDNFGEEPRRPATNRRRLDVEGSSLDISTDSLTAESLTAHSNPVSNSSGGSDARSSTRSAEADAAASPPTNSTTPASCRSPQSDSAVSSVPPARWTEPFDLAPSRPDPFAYLDNVDPPMFNTSPPTPLSSAAAAWGSDAALLAHPLFACDIPSHLTQPIPPHTHAYVAFGAGSRQKDVDTFTAAHPLGGGIVPYHVPLCVQKPSCDI